MTPEAKVKKEIQDGLKKLGIRYLRLNSGTVRVRGGFMHLCPTGTPDAVVFNRSGSLLWVEIKAALGKRSPDQEAFALWAAEVGHAYVLARNLEDVLKAMPQ